MQIAHRSPSFVHVVAAHKDGAPWRKGRVNCHAKLAAVIIVITHEAYEVDPTWCTWTSLHFSSARLPNPLQETAGLGGWASSCIAQQSAGSA